MSRNPLARALKLVRGQRHALDALDVPELHPELREARSVLAKLEAKAQRLNGPTAAQRREKL